MHAIFDPFLHGANVIVALRFVRFEIAAPATLDLDLSALSTRFGLRIARFGTCVLKPTKVSGL